MRQYPRALYKEGESSMIKLKPPLTVYTETEEMEASANGYESHWDSKVIESRKGTDKEILRGETAGLVQVVGDDLSTIFTITTNNTDGETVSATELVKPTKTKRKRRTKAQIKAGK